MLISFIIPCYNAEKNIRRVVDEIKAAFVGRAEYAYQIVLSCDGSPDDTFGEIRRLCQEDANIVGINLSRNFGQQAARMAGIPYAEGEYIVFLDDDGQHPAGEVFKLIKKLDEGYDIAYAHYKQKKHTLLQRMGSRLNAKMAHWLYGMPKSARASAFCAMKRFVAMEATAYTSPTPFTLGYFLQITRNIGTVPMEHRARFSGESGYTFFKLVRLWFHGFTSFSTVPLRISSVLGFIVSLIGFIMGAYMVIRKLIRPEIALGYTSTIAAILFVGGMIMLMLGLLGEYIARMFLAINNLPQYIIREKLNASASAKPK